MLTAFTFGGLFRAGRGIPAAPARAMNVWVLDMMDEDGKPEYTLHRLQHEPGAPIAHYLELLELDPQLLLYVALRGERIAPDAVIDVEVPEPWVIRMLRRALGIAPMVDTVRRLDYEVPSADDQLFIVPLLQGKNASLILGIVGAVIGFYLAGPEGAGWAWSWAAAQGALAGFAIGSYIGTLMTPRPSIGKGDKSITTFGWQGVQNEYRTGVPIPIAIGRAKQAGVRVGMFIRRERGGERLYMLFLLSIGPINGVSDVRINGQPYTNFGGDVSVQSVLGTTGQARLTGFNTVVNTVSQSAELTTTPYIYTTSRAVDAFEVLLTIPGLYHFDNTGGLVNNMTHYHIEYRATGASTWITPLFGDMRMNGSTRSIVRDTQRVQDLALHIYEIRMTWLVPSQPAEHNDPTKDAWKVYCTGVNEETQGAPTYDYGDHAYAMMAVRAIATDKLSGGAPLVTCVTEGILMQQYDGASLTAPQYSANAAWAALYLFLNTAVGAGNWIEGAEELDLQSFKDWADYNDETVTVTPDVGAPYTEKRHTLNVIINQQRPFLDMLLDLCACARATPVMTGDKWKMVIDRPGIVRQTFAGPGNIIENTLNIAYRSDANRTNTFDVSIMDEANDWNVEPFRVKSAYLVQTLGDPVKPLPLTLWGVTRRSHALREARFRLNTIAYLRRLSQFAAFTDAILIEVGDVIGVTHDVPQWGYPGRAKALGTTTSIVLDRPVTIEVGHTYEVLVRFQDGSNGAGTVRTVTNAPGTTSTLTFTAALPKAPDRDDIYAFGPTTLSTKPYRVVAITRSSGGIRKIIGLEYFETIYDDSGVVVIPSYSQLPNLYAPPPALSDLQLTELVEERTDLTRPSTLLMQWDRPLPVAGKGTFEGSFIDRSWDGGTTFETFGYHVGTEFRWQNAPQGVPITIRATPCSTKGVRNDAGAITQTITLHGWTTAPANIVANTPVSKDGRFKYSWQAQTRAIQCEIRDHDSGWGTDNSYLYRDHGTEFELIAPAARSVALYARAVDRQGNYSATTTTMTCVDPAPAAPTPLTAQIIASRELVKIPVTPPADTDVVALHLHASTTNGFTPLASNRVSSVVGGKGGDFTFRPPSSAAWFFRVTAEDPLSARLNDWVYSAQFSTALVTIVPQAPTSPTLSNNPTAQRRRTTRSVPGAPPVLDQVFYLFLNWTFSDSVNPSGSVTGFYVELYPSGGDPTVPVRSATIEDPAARSWGIDGFTIESAASYVGAVKALYFDGSASSLVTTSGLSLNPATSEDVLAQLKQDTAGGYYSIDTLRLTASDGSIITVDKNGMSVSTSDGQRRQVKYALHSILRGAQGGQWVPFNSSLLDPKLVVENFGNAPASKIHIVAQARQGASLAFQPLYYPARFVCDAQEVEDVGFRLMLAQVDGGNMSDLKDDAPTTGWTVNSTHSSLMTLMPTNTNPDPTNPTGQAAWYDPFYTGGNGNWGVIGDVLFAAVDMPSFPKPDGTFYRVDHTFGFMRDTQHLTWNGTYAGMAGSPNVWGPFTLRSYTNGQRWRLPIRSHAFTSPSTYLVWYLRRVFEDSSVAASCTPTRVLLDSFESHGISSGTYAFRASVGPEDVDILIIVDQ